MTGELTERQRQVLEARIYGDDHKSIAERLGISPCTSRRHLQEAIRKLGVRTFRSAKRRWLDLSADRALRAATD